MPPPAPAAGFLGAYTDIVSNLAIDLIAIVIMTHFLYFRRHWRADLVLAYIAMNIGIFVTMSVLTQVKVDIATGFGLFAILSIIRLAAGRVTQQEVAYYFVSLVLGLINGLNVEDRALAIGLNVVVLVVMAIADSPASQRPSRQSTIRLDRLYADEAELKATLERLVHGKVKYYEVPEVDFVRHTMTVDVRFQPYKGKAPDQPEYHPAEVEHKKAKKHPHEEHHADTSPPTMAMDLGQQRGMGQPRGMEQPRGGMEYPPPGGPAHRLDRPE